MTTEEMADRVGASASTVRNRIGRLEADGIIKGYHPEIESEAANLPLQLTFVTPHHRTNCKRIPNRFGGFRAWSTFEKC